MSRPWVGSLDYVYQPWSDERRAEHSRRAKLRMQGVIVPKIDAKWEVKRNRTLVEALLYGEAYAAGDYSKLEGVWRPKPKAVKAKKRKLFVSRAKVVLAYPFLPKARDEHADLLAVNSLVPRDMAGREDVCQEIMLAILEGRTTLDELRKNRLNIRAFVARFRADNLEAGGYAVSLDLPMMDGRSWHDVLSSEQAPYAS